MANKNLMNAKKAKQDEFYTRWEEIEQEVSAYIEYDKNVFKNKTILLPADDPFESNFFKFFAVHFNDFGLKELIATSYDSSPIVNTQLSLFGDEKQVTNTSSKAYKIDLMHAGQFNIEDVEKMLNEEKYRLNHGNKSTVLSYLKGDENYSAGDFRSREVTKLRNEADIIITNPPFSLFREFMKWVEPTKRHFLVIGNNNAVTYKEIFPLIENNVVWLGVHNGDMSFKVPNSYPPRKTRFWVDDSGQKWRSMGNIDWLTNLDHGRRHQPLSLMTMADNIKFSKHKDIQNKQYEQYDNYKAIEVSYVDAIPSDYSGIMGVPITFLNKYDPDQFKIIGLDRYTVPKSQLVGGRLAVQGKTKYARILIKAK